MDESLDKGKAMRLGMRRLASGVSVLSTFGEARTAFTMTVSSVTSISDDPASLLVCVNKDARICSLMELGQAFSINVLGRDQEEISIVCSSGEQSDIKLQTGSWDVESADFPFLLGAEAVFSCVVDQLVAYGTHNIVIGKILSVSTSSDEPDPLVYLNGQYVSLK